MSDPTTRNHATAADFVEYVAELRAEGLSDIRIFERYFKAARPGLCVWRDEECDDEVILTEPIVQGADDEEDGLGIVSVELTCEDKRFVIAFGTNIPCVWGDHVFIDDIHESLALIANHLAERCPVAAMTEEEANAVNEANPVELKSWGGRTITATYGDGSVRWDEWRCRKEDASDEAARLRRMFGIGEGAT